jgi:hypothetical protein
MIIFLIDMGEIVVIDISKIQLLQLPNDYESFPAQALLCKLDVTAMGICDPEVYLKQYLYTDQFYKVQHIEKCVYCKTEIFDLRINDETFFFLSDLLHVSLSSTKWVDAKKVGNKKKDFFFVNMHDISDL